jgi:hypothetical protein
MATNRISHLLTEDAAPTVAVTPAIAPAGLMPCPVSCLPGLSADRQAWMVELYRQALEMAQEQLRSAWYERVMRRSWN